MGCVTGAELNVLKGHTDWVNSVAISRDGMRIVSGSMTRLCGYGTRRRAQS
jgi:WD40 repeat protein